MIDDIDDPSRSNPAGSASSDIQGVYLFVSKYLGIMIYLLFERFDISINQCIRKIYGHAIERAIGAFAGTEGDMDVEGEQVDELAS
jgi:hypothetical protein